MERGGTMFRTNHLLIATGTLGLILMRVAIAPSWASAQDVLETPDLVPITAPAGREEGVAGDGPVWKEDVKRVENAVGNVTAPDLYMDSLRALGALDMLRERANLTEDDKAIDQWVRVGPVGNFGSPARNGRISGIQILQDGSYYRLYAGACQGGLWYCNSLTLSNWNDIGRNLPNPSVRAFTVDPDDFGHIIVGTGDHRRYTGAGMFETFDGGVTWSTKTLPIPTPSYFYRILDMGLDPTSDERRLVAASSGGVLFSDDNGSTWQRGRNGSGVALGDYWTDLVLQPDNPSWIYGVCCDETVGGDSGVYISYDYGETWSRFSLSNLPPSEDWSRASLALSSYNPQRLALMVTKGNQLRGIYRTNTMGLYWSDITGELIDPGSGYSFGGDQIWHAQAITFHPDDADFIIVGGVGLATTHDGGSTWEIGEDETGIDYGHVDFTQLHFSDLTGSGLMWMGNDGGIYYHRFNTGFTFSVMGNSTYGLACSEIDYMDAERLIRGIGLQDNGTVLSYDGGATWDFIEGGDGADVEIFDNVDGDVFYNNGYWGGVPTWKTWRLYRDGAKEFTNNPDVYMPRVYFSPYTGMAYTYGSTGLYSMNAAGALAWTQVYSNWQTLPYRTRNLWSGYGREESFWITYWSDAAGSSDGDEDLTYIFHGPSGWDKKHWENFNSSGNPVNWVTPSNEWPDEAWVGIQSSPGFAKIYHLLDGGDTKINITGNLSSVREVRTIAVTPFDPDVIYAGTDLGVYRTTDGGATWAPFMNGLPIGRCAELHFVEDHTHTGHHTLVLGMDGRGVWKCEIAAPPIIWVDSRRVTSGEGSRWSPFKTVAEAVGAAPYGSIIAIHADTYEEPQTIGKAVKLVTWQGDTIID